MDFRILGPLAVIGKDGAIELDRPLERAILALLVLHAGEVVSTERLLDELWPESPQESARHSLHVQVCRLRRALGEQALVTRRPGYMVTADQEEIDAWRFEGWVRDGRRALRDNAPENAVASIQRALALWRGSPLPELANLSVGQIQVSHLEELRFGALENLFEAELALGHHAEVVEGLAGLIRESPFRERLWGHLMVALYRSGRQAEALLAFREVKRLLGEELGIQPGPELQHLEEAIVLQSPELDWDRLRPART